MKFLVSIFAIFLFTSCSKSKDTCSCKTETFEFDVRISNVNSSEDTPSSGICADLNSEVSDPATNTVVRKLCN